MPEKMRSITYGNVVASSSEDALKQRIALLEAKKDVEHNPDFDNFLNEVDWNELDLILSDVVDRSGVKPEQMNALGPDRVLNKTVYFEGDRGLQVIGNYSVSDNIVTINYDFIQSLADELGVDPKLVALQTLINGKVNAAKRNALTIFNSKSSALQEEVSEEQQKATRVLESGYRKSVLEITGTFEKPQQNKTNFNELLNDAVVRKLGLEIFQEYLRRNGKLNKEKISQYFEVYFSNRNHTDSGELVHFMDELLDEVSKKAGIDREVVWHAFVRGLFETHAQALDDTDVKKWFGQTFAPDFLHKMSKAQSVGELNRLLAEYAQK